MCLLEEALSCSSVYRKFSRILDSVVRLDLDMLVNSLNKSAHKAMLNTLKFLKESAWPWLFHCHIQHQWRWQLGRSNLPLGLHVLHCLLPVFVKVIHLTLSETITCPSWSSAGPSWLLSRSLIRSSCSSASLWNHPTSQPYPSLERL